MGTGDDYWAPRPERAAPDAPAIGPNGFAVAGPPPAGTPQHRGSRWRGDSVTLGGWARVGMTGLLLLPVLWTVYFMGVAGFVFLGMYVVLVLPIALRDVWRRTRISLPPMPPETRQT